MLSLKRDTWSFRVLLSYQVNVRQPISWTACMQDWNCSLQWHLSPVVSPFSHHYRAWKYWWRCGCGLFPWACTMKFLGGVQCAQYWSHLLHPWFIYHGLASWDSDSEFLGSWVLCHTVLVLHGLPAKAVELHLLLVFNSYLTHSWLPKQILSPPGQG